MSYSDKLKDPRWQKKRLKIFERDNWTCRFCQATDKPLCVHHEEYSGEPWDAPDYSLKTLCEDCHSRQHEQLSAPEIALILRLRAIGFDDTLFAGMELTMKAVKIYNHEEAKQLVYKLQDLLSNRSISEILERINTTDEK